MDAPDERLREAVASYATRLIEIERSSVWLVDFCLLVATRKWAFISGFLIPILLALVIAVSTPQLFESRTVIQVGQLGPSRPLLESPEGTAERLREEHGVSEEESVRHTPFLKNVRVDRQAKNFLTLTAIGKDAVEAHQFLQEVVDRLVAEHTEKLNGALHAVRLRLMLLREQIERSQSALKTMESRMQDATKKGITSEAVILSVEKGRVLEHISKLEQQKVSAEAEILEIRAAPTRLVVGPTLPTGSTGMSRRVILFLGFLCGIAGGVVAVLVTNFVVALNSRRRQLLNQAD